MLAQCSPNPAVSHNICSIHVLKTEQTLNYLCGVVFHNLPSSTCPFVCHQYRRYSYGDDGTCDGVVWSRLSTTGCSQTRRHQTVRLTSSLSSLLLFIRADLDRVTARRKRLITVVTYVWFRARSCCCISLMLIPRLSMKEIRGEMESCAADWIVK